MNDLPTSGGAGALTSLILVLKLKFLKVIMGECLPLPGPQFPFSSLDCEPNEFLICSLDYSELKVVCKVTPFQRLWGQQGIERAGFGDKFQLCRTRAVRRVWGTQPSSLGSGSSP